MIYLFRESPAGRQARPKRERKEPAKYQGWQKTVFMFKSVCNKRFWLYYFEDKGEVNCGLESYPENLGLKGLGIIFSY